MKSLRAAGFLRWQQRALFTAGLFALLAPLHAAPFKSKISRKSSAGASIKTPPAAVRPAQPLAEEHADLYPSSVAAAEDLLLVREQERKADALASFARALVAEDSAESDQALEGYRRTLELDPSYAELAVKVAFELARRNDPSAGIQVLKDAVKASPKEAIPLIYLSQLYSKHLKKPEVALKYAEQAVAIDPNNVAAHLALVEVHVLGGNAKKAELALDRAIQSDSTDPEFWLQIGEIYSRLHLKGDDAPVAPEALEKMNTIFRKAAALGKDDAVVQAKVGNYFVDSKQTNAAVSYYLAALSLKQDADEPALANARDKLAKALLQNGKPDEAIALLEQITKDDPLRFATFELLGELYEQKGDIDKALANYQHSILLDASEPTNHVRVAEMQMRLKRFNEAVDTALSARARFPEHPHVLYLLAITFSQAKRHTEAMTAFAEAQSEFEADHEELLNAAFYFSYGAAAEQAGLTDRAAELLKKCIQLDPANAAQAYNYLGYMYADRGENLEEAGKLIQKAVEAEPENGAYLDSLGWYYYKKGDYQAALRELLRAAEIIKPEDAVVYDHLADVYHQLGNIPEAIRNWQKSLALQPEEKDGKRIAEKLESVKQKVTSSAHTPPAPVVAAPAK